MHFNPAIQTVPPRPEVRDNSYEDGYIPGAQGLFCCLNIIDSISLLANSCVQAPLINLSNSEIVGSHGNARKNLILVSYAVCNLVGSLVVGIVETILKLALGIIFFPLFLAQLIPGSNRTIQDVLSLVPILFFATAELSIRKMISAPRLSYNIVVSKEVLPIDRFNIREAINAETYVMKSVIGLRNCIQGRKE